MFATLSDGIRGNLAGINSLHLASILVAVVTTYLACHPILAFVRRGWKIKQYDILSSLTKEAKALYIQTFLKIPVTDPEKQFRAMYVHRYGKYRLVVPVLLLVIILLPTTYSLAETALARFSVIPCLGKTCTAGRFMTLAPKAAAALAGAYIWVAFALIAGASQYNLPPGLVLSSALRIVVAAPLGYAIGALAEPGLGVFLAFAIGAFPLGAIQTILQRVATKQLKLDISTDPDGKDGQVTRLSGVDPPTADRLQSGDITTIPQLAYCDPVQLSMRTNLSFDFVVDLVDQALAWIYLDDKMKVICPYGLRGAMEIGNLVVELGDETTKEQANEVFAACSKATDLDASGLRHAFEEIAEDPYTIFLSEVWATNP